MSLPYAPSGFGTVTPFIIIENATAFIDFIKAAFEAREEYVLRHSDGTLWHAQMKIGDSMLLVADAGDMAARHAATPAQIALAWMLTRPSIAAPIVSATTLPQLGDLLKAPDIRLSGEDVAMLDAASAEEEPATRSA